MEKQATLFGVSLGPGDPDLITVKGLEVLKKVDKIYYPGSLYKDGTKTSYSWSILEYYQISKEKCKGYYLEMSLGRAQAKQSYEAVFQDIVKDLQQGLSVAVVAEGDINTYSSFSYLLEKAKDQQLHTVLVPGITSYALGAALHKEPLCLQNEQCIILPRVPSVALLQETLEYYDTVVLMKIMSVIPIIDEVLQNNPCQVFYSERLGTSQEYISTDWEVIKHREIPYFSLMMLKK